MPKMGVGPCLPRKRGLEMLILLDIRVGGPLLPLLAQPRCCCASCTCIFISLFFGKFTCLLNKGRILIKRVTFGRGFVCVQASFALADKILGNDQSHCVESKSLYFPWYLGTIYIFEELTLGFCAKSVNRTPVLL